jgi:hypothetical protein
MDQLFQQFGPQAAAVQELFNALIAPLQQQIQELQAQLEAPVPPQLNAQDLAAAVAQAVVGAQPQAQQAIPHHREPKVADPPFFKGNKDEVESFIRSVRTCFTLSPSRFPPGDETRRILFTLGFIQEGTAGTWANNLANAMLNQNVQNPFNTFQEFQEAFERSFGSMDKAQKARTDMSTLKMKPGDTVEGYTTTFESLAIHTGYNEAALIEHYRSGLLHRIIEKIYGDSNGHLPDNLEGWKTKARHLDNLYQEFKALQLRNGPSSSTNNHRPQRPAPPRMPTTPTSPASHSAPEAMDVDGHRKSIRCYNCGKFGHIARRCPNPNQTRSIRTVEIAEVVRAVLAETQGTKGDEVSEQVSDFPASQQ